MPSGTSQPDWRRILRRIRVPLGFLTAVLTLIFAKPTALTLLLSLPLVLAGLWLRGYAAGYVKKNAELTRTGPYAFTRNPLYLGSLGILCGFALAAGRLSLAILLIAFFLLIYIPTILSEEAFLRATFPTFPAYAMHVPRLLPRFTAALFPDADPRAGRFDRSRYLHHREYNATMGAGAIYALLAVRMLLFRGHV
jgi:protein-S-isoprenylcysteine O-methyltransferase Ste14